MLVKYQSTAESLEFSWAQGDGSYFTITLPTDLVVAVGRVNSEKTERNLVGRMTIGEVIEYEVKR